MNLLTILDRLFEEWDGLGTYKDDDFGDIAEVINLLREFTEPKRSEIERIEDLNWRPIEGWHPDHGSFQIYSSCFIHGRNKHGRNKVAGCEYCARAGTEITRPI